MHKEFETKINDFAKGDIDDMVGLFQICDWVAKPCNPTNEVELMDFTLEFVAEAMKVGFRVGCSPYFETGFKLWDNQELQHVRHEIKSAWKELGRPDLTTNIWFGLPGYKYD